MTEVGRQEIGWPPRAKRWSQPLPLRVEPEEHRSELERFWSRVVRGPLETDCWVWVGGLSDDGYGVFRIRRYGVRHVVRTSRYALALSLAGDELPPEVLALHECDNTVCVRTLDAAELRRGLPAHVVGGDQQLNMMRMARMRRGGGRRAIIARGAGVAARAERARAIREAVKDGWDQERLTAALLGDAQQPLW